MIFKRAANGLYMPLVRLVRTFIWEGILLMSLYAFVTFLLSFYDFI